MGTKAGTIKIAKCIKNGQRMWRVNVPISLAGQRMRKFFPSERDAIQWADDFEHTVKTHGQAALQVQGKSVNEVLTRFWALKEMSGRHLGTAKNTLNQFAKKHGNAPIAMISPLQLQSFWSRPNWSQSHRAKTFRYLRLFFNWAERYDFIDRNPTRRVEPPKVSETAKHILAPERMQELCSVQDSILHAFLCLGGFAGLRTSEILALQPEDIGTKEIHVRKGKTGERFITILPTFKRQWDHLPKFPHFGDFYAHIRAIAGSKWPANCLRHSFGTYHLAQWQDAPRTAHQMGNSPAIVLRSYARAVPRKSAEKWWKL